MSHHRTAAYNLVEQHLAKQGSELGSNEREALRRSIELALYGAEKMGGFMAKNRVPPKERAELVGGMESTRFENLYKYTFNPQGGGLTLLEAREVMDELKRVREELAVLQSVMS